jgi:hypothetical protein
MDNIILQKRSTVPNAAPTTVQLETGEVALNVADGRVFIKTTSNTVVDLMSYAVADGGEITTP